MQLRHHYSARPISRLMYIGARYHDILSVLSCHANRYDHIPNLRPNFCLYLQLLLQGDELRYTAGVLHCQEHTCCGSRVCSARQARRQRAVIPYAAAGQPLAAGPPRLHLCMPRLADAASMPMS